MTIPWLINPYVYTDYFSLWRNQSVPTPYDWEIPTLGYLLRKLFNLADGRVLYLPPFIGALWFFGHWRKHRADWDWRLQMPLLLLISLSTASFAWSFDHVVLLPAIIQGATWVIGRRMPRRTTIAVTTVYALMNVLYLVMIAIVINEFWYFPMAPGYLGLYLWLRGRKNREASRVSESSPDS